MTNAEAIEEIKSRISTTEYVGGSYVDCVDLEALKLAIKALEARWPCDKCIYNPPSSMGRKPCSCCPAEPYREDGD